MNNSNDDNTTLFNLSFKKLCENMNHDTVKMILKFYPPSLIFQIMNKFFHVYTQRKEKKFHRYLDSVEAYGFGQGHNLVQMEKTPVDYTKTLDFDVTDTMIENFANTQQTLFDDKFDFCNHFDLDLFFKLVKLSEYRKQLYFFFQICVQKQGLTFPKQLANQWIEIQTQQIDINLYNIECGLKFGIFLGDTGWFIESALVLAYTYDMITTKWVCFDQNLKQIKMIQCLAKWLLVVSNYYNYQEAKFVLPLTLEMINIFEKMGEKNVNIAYAYVAVSQFHYIFMNYVEAWTWAVKAVNELHDNCSESMKLSVINHVIKASSAADKFRIAKKLIEHTCTHKKEFEQTVCVDVLLNAAHYSWKKTLTTCSIPNYYFVLDFKRNLFGYYNLSTAIIFVDFAYAQYISNCLYSNNTVALWSLVQGIFIMKKIGLPDNNMLLMKALELKALLLLNKGYIFLKTNCIRIHNMGDGSNLPFFKVMKRNAKASKHLFLKSIDIYRNEFGENNMFLANVYGHLSDIYQKQGKLMKAKQLILKAIDIKKLILNPSSPELALSFIQLANLLVRLEIFLSYAEDLYWLSKKIYLLNFGPEYIGLKHVLRGLAEIYFARNDMVRYRECTNTVVNLKQLQMERRFPMLIFKKYSKPNICLEELKGVLNDRS